MSLAYHAETLARRWHAGQTRRDGKTPYITHPEAVAAAVHGDEAKAVAWLHDVLEDTGIYIEELGQFPDEVIEAVFLLTKGDEVFYNTYIAKIAMHPLARIVKIADIRHNLSCDPTPAQVKKYHEALALLGADE